jgi:hypothetical protein
MCVGSCRSLQSLYFDRFEGGCGPTGSTQSLARGEGGGRPDAMSGEQAHTTSQLAALAAKRKRPKLHASTLRRLTAIPAHKVRHDNRHFPAGLLGGGSGSAAQMSEL